MEATFRTEQAVRSWTAALPAAAYDVRLVPADGDGPALRRQVSGGGLLRLLPWLRSMNARDHHIYARPASPAYVLIDDLDEDGLDALRAAGHRPAAVVVTSPANHQVWLRLAEEEDRITPALSSGAARLAAGRFDGDPGAASSAQVGRLPGFTNRKDIHADRHGRYPFVLLRAAPGGVDPGGSALLRAAAACPASPLPGSPRFFAGRPTGVPFPSGSRLRPCTPEVEWKEGQRRVLAELPPGTILDHSRLDHAVAVRLLCRGATQAYVRAVLLAGERGGMGRAARAYVARTLDAAQRTTEC
ncbi:DNA-primase RepB domain-containing protein [Roseomonas harenae]|uniref:DNA-primase RepB domain-containing protein n=1 Tax=Muricoccus harenae TaxID=2692566 RepID=UPI00133176D4|nr:DNA-primase RepB domain-containing protein [Roseomonas harenae]